MTDDSPLNDDYLWDKSGEPDPDVARLEEQLGTMRYDRAAPDLRKPRRIWPWVAAAAAVLVGVAYFADRGVDPPAGEAGEETAHQSAESSAETWSCQVTDLSTPEGTISKRQIGVGEWIETGAADRVELTVADIGTLNVLPDSRVGLVRTGQDEHRVRLDRGAIHAVVDAPPRLFVVETPAADAVDLGCEYTLAVDKEGNGTLEVATGSVSLERGGRTSTVPEGAVCAISAATGPGTPHFPGAADEFTSAVARIDGGTCGSSDVATVLRTARKQDTLTLWHLLSQVEGEERALVHDRMVSLAPPPDACTREGALRLDEDMLEAWFEELRFTAFDWRR